MISKKFVKYFFWISINSYSLILKGFDPWCSLFAVWDDLPMMELLPIWSFCWFSILLRAILLNLLPAPPGEGDLVPDLEFFFPLPGDDFLILLLLRCLVWAIYCMGIWGLIWRICMPLRWRFELFYFTLPS